MEADDWEELGILAQTPSPSKKRPRASCRAHETTVTMEGKSTEERGKEDRRDKTSGDEPFEGIGFR